MANELQCHQNRGFRHALLALLIVGFAGTAQGRTETLTWQDPNPLPSPVAGFRIHVGPSSRSYTTVIEVGLPTPDPSGVYSASLQVIDDATVHVALTAYDLANLESDFSNEQMRAPAAAGGPPTARPDAYPANQDTPLAVDVASGVLANDSDPDSDPLTAVLATGATSGALQLNGDGSFQYTPVPGFAGTDSFTYRASDGNDLSTSATVTIDVLPAAVNQPPESTIAVPVAPQTITEGQAVFFAGSGSDPEGDSDLSYSWDFGDPAIAPTTVRNPASVVFPNTGTFEVHFAVTDSAGATDPTPDSVTITVQSANQPPESTIAVPVAPQTITEGQAVFFAGSGSDPEGDSDLSYSWDFGDPAIPPSSARNPGSVVFSQAGTFDVRFAVTDSAGATDPTPASVRITVEAADEPPPEVSVDYLDNSSIWRYFDSLSIFETTYPTPDAQGDEWNEADFDDSSWPTGSGLFGYGELDGLTPDTVLTRRITYLFRTTFDVTELPDSLTASILRDDAFILYLNGVEVARDNISGSVTARTQADSSIRGVDESTPLSLALDPADLVVGTNSLTVEIHNYSERTSDASFGLSLEGVVSDAANETGNDSFVPASATVDVELVATGFDAPVYLTSPTGDARLFVLEAGGGIFIIENGSVLPTPFLDLSSDVSDAPAGGLLGMAFDPDYDQNGYFYVHRTAASGDSVLSRFSVSSDPNVAAAGSEQVILQLSQPFNGQNGGAIAFGPDDGFLYVGLGDGGATGDPGNRAQDGNSLLGKLLRLDVGVPPAPASIPADAYAIPADNPFVGDPGVRSEIWALGLRNPYRFSFDRELRDLWLADEGQAAREEVNFEAWNDAGGNNYGWDVMEGAVCNDDDPAPAPSCSDTSLVPPLHDYPHTNGNCAITGGYVNRSGVQDLVGEYFFADYCSGGVWSLDVLTGDGTDWTQALGEAAGKPFQLVSFGESGDGDLYVLHLDGNIYRIGSSGAACDQAVDSDCDGIPDDGAPGDVPCATGQTDGCDDNCPFAANPGQEDTAGVGLGSAPDGIGDECQCGDVNADGMVSIEDSLVILEAMLDPPAAIMSRPDLCDVGDAIGCSSTDGMIIYRAQQLFPTATVEQVCEPANAP